MFNEKRLATFVIGKNNCEVDMGGGKDNKVEETEYERVAAEVSNKYWDIYQNDLKQFEDTFIKRVDNFNSASNMADAKATVDMGYNKAFSENRQQTTKALSSASIDPTSGKFKGTMADLATAQGTAQTDTINRAQAAEQDKHIAGLSDVASMGMGEQADALNRIGDVANMSLSEAKNDAYTDFNKRASNLQLVGAAAGVGLRSYQHMAKPNALSSVDGVSTQRNNRYNHVTNPDGQMIA
ncbi:hypothetical protein [Enterovibrio norvegicus]|uniref:hypothetical protein n=1 Tax=Enterovibrio norvegicus TaxID=188144 RepID=UPI001F516A85|nr:hypothetical protein [Enterovibrio norvegicus]